MKEIDGRIVRSLSLGSRPPDKVGRVSACLMDNVPAYISGTLGRTWEGRNDQKVWEQNRLGESNRHRGDYPEGRTTYVGECRNVENERRYPSE